MTNASKPKRVVAVPPSAGNTVSASSPEAKSLSQADALQVVATSFVVLFCVVGLALWGLPFYYDFMVQQFGWTRA